MARLQYSDAGSSQGSAVELSGTARERSSAGAMSKVLAVRIILFCAIGLAVNITPIFMATFSVLLESIEKSLGQSRTAIMSGHAACLVALALSGPIAGRLSDRFGQNRVLAVGIPLLSLVLSSFYWLPPSLPLFLAQCVMVGVTGALSNQFVYFSVVSMWFNRRLGMALAVAGMGGSIGFLIFVPLASRIAVSEGWQSAFLTVGIISAVVALPNLLLYRRPQLDAAKSISDVPDQLEGVPVRQVVRTSAFWRLALSFFFMCLMLNGFLLHMPSIMTGRGIAPDVAAQMVSLAGVGILLGRLGSGVMLIRFNGGYVGGGIFLMGVVGAILLIPAKDPFVLACGILLLSLTLGSEGELLNFMAQRMFGLRDQGAILGMLTAAYLLGTLTGPMLMSVWFDATKQYESGQMGLAIAGLIAAILHGSLGRAVRPDASRSAMAGSPAH